MGDQRFDAGIAGGPLGNQNANWVIDASGNANFNTLTVRTAAQTSLPGATFTGPVLFSDGTAAAPSASFASDPDTGFWHDIANAFTATVGGTSAVRFLSDGITLQGSTPGIYAWSSGDPTSTSRDTAFGRGGAGKIYFGNSSLADNSGTIGDLTHRISDIFMNGGLGGNASTGGFGECLSVIVATASAITLATGSAVNVTQLSLTAGDWDVVGIVDYVLGATTYVGLQKQGISTTSVTFGAQDTFTNIYSGTVLGSVGSDTTQLTPTIRVLTSVATTVFLVSSVNFAVSTAKAYGTLKARRVR